MLKASGFDVFFAAAGNLYLLLMVGGIALAIWKGRTKKRKVIFAALVALLFLAPILPEVYRTYEHKQRYAKAKALFDERCKTAGEKIYRTVEGVEGVLLTNVRPERISAAALNDPYWPDAALPYESGGDGYVRTFLFWEHHQDKRNARGFLNEQMSDLPGYGFVDAIDPNAKIMRYRLQKAGDIKLVTEPIKTPTRYAISYRNMVDPDDRKYWVAGTRVEVRDTQANEVIAYQVWYSFEPGLGNRDGERSPWAFAQTCPQPPTRKAPTRLFVDQVLKPLKGK